MFLNQFPKHLIVTPNEQTKQGWQDLHRNAPSEQKKGHAVYFTPNGFDTLSREESDVKQFNSVYIDVDAPKGQSAEAVEQYVQKKIGEVFPTLEPSFIVRTKNGAHFHFLLTEPLAVTEETKRNYIHVMDSMVRHFDADLGAKGINRVLRVPGYKHYKDITDPYEVHLLHESPETRYTLEEIAEAIGVSYPAPITVGKSANFGEFTADMTERLERMLSNPKIHKLYNGDASHYDDDMSRADSALCCHLAFWFDKDPIVIEQLWLRSPLGQREKTQQRAEYRSQTIERAVAITTEVYTPSARVAPIAGEEPKCYSRIAYKKHLAEENWDSEEWIKKLKSLETDYFMHFYEWFAISYPHLKFEDGKRQTFWDYNEAEGVYEVITDVTVIGLVISLLRADGLDKYTTETHAKRVIINFMADRKRAVTLDSFVTNSPWLHVNNGWLNLDELKLHPHTPDKLSLYKMAVDYDAQATCPLYDRFLDEDIRMNKDAVRVIDQYSGYMLTESIEEQQMLVFEGRPGCGKSTIPRLWLKILGKKGTTASLNSLSQGEVRFMGDVFAHRNFCFFDEANPKTQNINEYFMNMVDKDDIKIERKGIQGHVDVRNTLKIVLALNEMPDHQPEGFARRYRHFIFTRSFTDEGVADRQFQKKIETNELPGVLNRMIRGLQDYKKMGGLTMMEGEEERKRNHTLAADDISAFIEEHFVPVNDGIIRYNYKDMRGAFVAEFPKSYNKQLSVQAFNKKLQSVRLSEFKHITTAKSGGNRGYKGIELKPGHTFDGVYEPIMVKTEDKEW